MKQSLLYHRVRPDLVDKLLDSGHIKQSAYDNGAICMTRDVNYLAKQRPFVIIFDRDKLRRNFKVRPFCFLGWHFFNNQETYERWSKKYTFGFEREERVYGGDIPLHLAEYVGYLDEGRYDYKQPKKQHLKIDYLKNFFK
jgi:hypothetical protein